MHMGSDTILWDISKGIYNNHNTVADVHNCHINLLCAGLFFFSSSRGADRHSSIMSSTWKRAAAIVMGIHVRVCGCGVHVGVYRYMCEGV